MGVAVGDIVGVEMAGGDVWAVDVVAGSVVCAAMVVGVIVDVGATAVSVIGTAVDVGRRVTDTQAVHIVKVTIVVLIAIDKLTLFIPYSPTSAYYQSGNNRKSNAFHRCRSSPPLCRDNLRVSPTLKKSPDSRNNRELIVLTLWAR